LHDIRGVIPGVDTPPAGARIVCARGTEQIPPASIDALPQKRGAETYVESRIVESLCGRGAKMCGVYLHETAFSHASPGSGVHRRTGDAFASATALLDDDGRHVLGVEIMFARFFYDEIFIGLRAAELILGERADHSGRGDEDDEPQE